MQTVAWAILSAVVILTIASAQTPPGKPERAAEKTAPPRKPPELSLQRPGAGSLPLSRYRGKIVALTFISTICSHCQDFTKAINPIARTFAPRGVQFVECAVNDGAEAGLERFITQFEPAFPVGWCTQEAMATFLGAMFGDPQALYVPHMVLLDRAGLVRGDFPPGSDFYRQPSVSVPAALLKLLKR